MDTTAAVHTNTAEVSKGASPKMVRDGLQKELDANDKGAFTVTTVNVRNLLTNPAIDAAIHQRAETAQAIERKRKEVELAKAEDERLVVEAKGQAEANEIISRSRTPAFKEIKLAELQRDAAIAIAGKAGNTVLLNGGTPLVSVGGNK